MRDGDMWERMNEDGLIRLECRKIYKRSRTMHPSSRNVNKDFNFIQEFGYKASM